MKLLYSNSSIKLDNFMISVKHIALQHKNKTCSSEDIYIQ